MVPATDETKGRKAPRVTWRAVALVSRQTEHEVSWRKMS